MNCRSCGAAESRVINCVSAPKTVARVRQCVKCSQRWKTIECFAAQDALVEVFKTVKAKTRTTT